MTSFLPHLKPRQRHMAALKECGGEEEEEILPAYIYEQWGDNQAEVEAELPF